MNNYSDTAPPEFVAVKVEVESSWEPGQQAAPPPELAAVKQEVDVEEHDLLQRPEALTVNYHGTTDRKGMLLTPIESNVNTRTQGYQIISESNIKAEHDPLSEEECKIKTEKDSLLNENSLNLNGLPKDSAHELHRSGRFCPECPVLFPSCSALAAHLNVQHSYAPADRSEDNTAPRALNASDAIQKSKESAKSSSAANCSLRCEHCDYSCAAAETLRRHSGLHDPARRHECNVCHYRFSTLCKLNIHLKKHTGVKPYKCNLCEFKCSRKDGLSAHMIRHTKEKQFLCDQCDYRSFENGALNRHKIRRHNKEKPFKCELCEYKCKQIIYLKTHMRRHTNEKPFKCDLCEYKCSQSSALNSHKLNRHTKEKPFKCNVCDYKCAQKQHLTTHMRRHTKEKPFECDQCDYRSSLRHILRSHKMRKHAKEK